MAPILFHFHDSTLGVLLIALGILSSVYLLRECESRRSDNGREEIIADQIESAANSGGRVVAVVGQRHADDVCDELPGWIDPIREPPKYQVYSPRLVWDLSISFWKSYLPIVLIAILIVQ